MKRRRASCKGGRRSLPPRRATCFPKVSAFHDERGPAASRSPAPRARPGQRIVYARTSATMRRCQTGGRLLADRRLQAAEDDWTKSIDDLDAALRPLFIPRARVRSCSEGNACAAGSPSVTSNSVVSMNLEADSSGAGRGVRVPHHVLAAARTLVSSAFQPGSDERSRRDADDLPHVPRSPGETNMRPPLLQVPSAKATHRPAPRRRQARLRRAGSRLPGA